jgi:hypothetical protein
LDQAFVSLSGHTYAFEFGPNFGFHDFHDVDLLYSSNHITITLGYSLITLFFLPAGFLNLNDNVKTVQVGSFIFFIVLMMEFIGYFIFKGNNDGYQSLPAFGGSYKQLVSVFIFSWAYVIFVPSWLNEKGVNVSVNKVIWWSGIVSWIGYIIIGILCAAVFSGSDIGLDNFLVSLSKKNIPTLTRITAHLFSLGVIAPGIPVCSVTTRYNLYVGGVCGKKASYFWGCIAPWIVGFIFCQGEIFANLLNWTSLVFNGAVNFLVPFLMYMSSLKLLHTGGAPKMHGPSVIAYDTAVNSYLERKQKEDESNRAEEGEYEKDGEEHSTSRNRSSSNSTVGVPISRPSSYITPAPISLAAPSGSSLKTDLAAPLLSSSHKHTTHHHNNNTHANYTTPPGSSPALLSDDSPEPSVIQPPNHSSMREGYLLHSASDVSASSTPATPAVHYHNQLSSHTHTNAYSSDQTHKHGPVYPFPMKLRPYAYRIIMGLTIATICIIVVQTGVDIYFASIGQNLLS